MKLRPYQVEATKSVFDYYQYNNGNPVIVAPTGCGKSVITANIVKQLCFNNENRTIIVSHRKEILSQNASKMFSVWPEIPLAIYSAGLNQKRFARVTIAGIQSIAKHAKKIGHVDSLIVDECHLIPQKGEGNYRTFVDELKKFNPQLQVIGLTATPYRLDSGLLTEGNGRIFTDICYSISIADLIRDGYLVPLISKVSANVEVDRGKIRTSGNDFVMKSAEEVFLDDNVTEKIIDDMLRKGQGRKHGLLFTSGIDHANKATQILKSKGVKAECVTSQTMEMHRDLYLGQFQMGKIEMLVGCDVFTTGFDSPNVDLIGLARPTKSTGLFVQMLGRGMRPNSGKKDCLVLDYAGNLEEHGPIDCIGIGKKDTSTGKTSISKAPSKRCPECESQIQISFKTCPDCGFVFSEESIRDYEKKLHVKSSDAPIIASIEPIREIDVKYVTYAEHQKKGKTKACMRVIYEGKNALEKYFDFIHFEQHGNQLGFKAARWWSNAGGNFPCPKTTAEAIERQAELRTAKKVFVQFDNPWWRVVSVHYLSEQEEEEQMQANMEWMFL